MAKNELLLRDIEGVTKYFQKEMPVRFEADQESVFSMAFSLNINQKKMKRIEKEYMTMKSKEAEDEMEIRRLRTENRLVRQKMDMLEQESSDLADRLLQGQVTRAEEEENCFVIRQELAAAKMGRQQATERVEEASHGIEKLKKDLEETRMGAFKSKTEQEGLIRTKDKEIQSLQDKISKMMDGTDSNVEENIAEHQMNDKGQVSTAVSEDEVSELKNISEEAKKHLQDLRSKVRDLKSMWKIHLQRSGSQDELKQTTSAPKKLFNSLLEGTSEVGRLEEELISSRLREVETVAELKEWKMKTREMESQTKTSRNQLSRQDDIVLRLQEELEDYKRKTSDLKSQLRESHIKFSNLEGKLKDDQLMSRIKEAENTQNVAELRQQISSLELKNQEMAAIGDLNLCLGESEDMRELQDRIECLTVEVTRLSLINTRLATASYDCDCHVPSNCTHSSHSHPSSPASSSSSSPSSSSLRLDISSLGQSIQQNK
eukprot:GFUD01004449.1.p1 GENE.GFUD01004449.1~~GFUD01004449.1.p1  ORF type:complete len:563 (+),score=181.11 GFUD01004449.1:228-1691(+)